MQARYRPFLMVALVVAVLLGGWLLERVADPAANDSPGISQGELTAESAAPQTPATSGAGKGGAATTPAVATATPRARRDLGLDESRGGHTLTRHVGLSDADLRARLNSERDISAASTFYDRDTAERAVGAVLAMEADEVDQWVGRSGRRPNLALRTTMPAPVGRSWRRGDVAAADAAGVVVVLSWTGTDWYVLTSYPEYPR